MGVSRRACDGEHPGRRRTHDKRSPSRLGSAANPAFPALEAGACRRRAHRHRRNDRCAASGGRRRGRDCQYRIRDVAHRARTTSCPDQRPCHQMTRGAWSLWRYVPRLFPYLRPYRGLAVASVLLTALAVVVGLAEPWPLAFIVDVVLGNKEPPTVVTQLIGHQGRYTFLVLAAVAGLLLVVWRNAMSVLHEYVNTKLHQWLVLDFRSDLFEHAQRLSVSYHDSTQTGKLMTQINLFP